MSNRAYTPEQLVRQWIDNAQCAARCMERYQAGLDELARIVKEQAARLEAYSSRFYAHERLLGKTLRMLGNSAGGG